MTKTVRRYFEQGDLFGQYYLGNASVHPTHHRHTSENWYPLHGTRGFTDGVLLVDSLRYGFQLSLE